MKNSNYYGFMYYCVFWLKEKPKGDFAENSRYYPKLRRHLEQCSQTSIRSEPSGADYLKIKYLALQSQFVLRMVGFFKTVEKIGPELVPVLVLVPVPVHNGCRKPDPVLIPTGYKNRF